MTVTGSISVTLRKVISDRLTQFKRQGSVAGTLKTAAVALTVVDQGYGADLVGLPQYDIWSNDPALLLTRRSSRLRNHSGQWALPGGRLDDGESAEDAALRELEEEVGLSCRADQVLGLLDDFVTRSGYLITPVVVWADTNQDTVLNLDEVESIHRIPMTEFLRKDAPILESIPESNRPVLRMPVANTSIAAPTAAVIFQFREVCLSGKNTRVAHFEQPVFAWH